MSPTVDHTDREQSSLTLSELNRSIRQVIHQAFADTYWVRAELSDVRVNASSGHCYLEFIEKSPLTGQISARVRGNIWAKTFRMVKPYFEKETGQAFSSGIKVLVKVTVDFHELYGLSLTVTDIDPAYTLGDILKKRMEIIRQLQEEGVLNLNKEIPFPLLPQRIAVITSPTAAGYEDFLDQLMTNKEGYPFYIKLFPAVMQGEKTESSIIEALDRIYNHVDCFDVVVIIRGGGATSELNCFDSYLLAANCAQFPLPVITGIGHERDDSVLDLVAHTRMKTPTAVAEFLIGQMDQVATELHFLNQAIITYTSRRMQTEKNTLNLLGNRLPLIATGRIEQSRSQLVLLQNRLGGGIRNRIDHNQTQLGTLAGRICYGVREKMNKTQHELDSLRQFIRLVSPENVLKRGYSLVLKEGEIIKSTGRLIPGDRIQIRMADGEIESEII